MKQQLTPIIPQTVSIESDGVLYEWLDAQANEHQLIYLLAHADDGVIWGRFENEKLKTADSIGFKKGNLPSLRLNTLQECRIFGLEGEIFLWCVDGIWKARHISKDWEKSYLDSKDYVTENQLLWGTTFDAQKDGFTFLKDGSQGLRHAVPFTKGIELDSDGKNLKNPVRLVVHHYIDYDPDDGTARIFLSRLVDLKVNNREI